MFQFPAHTQDLGSSVQFDAVPDSFQAEGFQGPFLPLGLSNAASYLGDSYLFHCHFQLRLSH